MTEPGTAAQRELLRRVAAQRAGIQDQAAALDVEAAFPHACFAALAAEGLLSATLPEQLGGAGFGAGVDGAAALNRLLYLLGEANLSVARIFEAHVNALQLILRYGTPGQAARAAGDAQAGHLFGLWVTDPLAGGGVRLDSQMVLHGEKAICSGAGVASRALITAQTPAGAQMLVVALPSGAPERVAPSRIKLAGMRAAVTGAIDFSGMELGADAVLGVPEDYLREPVFSAGAWRSAAAGLSSSGAGAIPIRISGRGSGRW
jgi:alkylation response protein AidB-like acyl-CoA dehydrogenase